MKITDDMLTDERLIELAIFHKILGIDGNGDATRSYGGRDDVLNLCRAVASAARRTTPDRECEWKCDDIDNGIWESACGESWSFIDGGPVENRMLFCHRCGGKLRTAPTSDKGGA